MKVILFLLPAFFLFSCKEKSLHLNNGPVWVVVDTTSKGTFVNTDAHQLNGKAYICTDVKDNLQLVLEDLSVIGGPDVDVYLSDSAGYKNVVKCGHLPGEDGQLVEGDLSFPLSYYDLKHEYVIIWCKKYSVMFGYAKLNKTKRPAPAGFDPEY